LGLVDEQVIDAQLVEDQPVVLLLLGEQSFQLLLAGRFLLLKCLDNVAVGAGVALGAVAQELLVLGDLLAQEPLLVTRTGGDESTDACAVGNAAFPIA
jgi:hypothetical protein